MKKFTHARERKMDIRSLPVHQRIKRFKIDEKKPLVRPKAKYDNKSREERINELLAEGTNNY